MRCVSFERSQGPKLLYKLLNHQVSYFYMVLAGILRIYLVVFKSNYKEKTQKTF